MSKEGSIRKKGNNIELRICIGGKQKSFYGKSEAEARKKARDYTKSLLKQEKSEQVDKAKRSKELLGEYIIKYLTTYKYQTIKDSSYDILERVYYNQIIKFPIAYCKICDLTPDMMQNYLNELNNTFSTSTIKKVIEVMNPALDMAVEIDLIRKNPLRIVKIPRKQEIIDIDEMYDSDTSECYTEEEAQIITDECMGHYGNSLNETRRYRYAPAYVLLLNTGMRIGELAALTWDDVTENTIKINKTITVVSNRGRYKGMPEKVSLVTPPKTKNSIRIIPLNSTSKICLRELKKRQVESGIHSKFVIASPNGGFMQTRVLYQTFKRICEEHKIECKGLHALRHTFGSLLIMKGTDIKVVSSILGHSTVKFTYDRYIHVMGNMKANAIELINTTTMSQKN